MMPRLVRLIADRRAKSKQYSNPPLEQVTEEGPSGERDSGSGTARQMIRDYTSSSSKETPRVGDVELAMWSPVDQQMAGDSLAQQVDVDSTLPSISHP